VARPIHRHLIVHFQTSDRRGDTVALLGITKNPICLLVGGGCGEIMPMAITSRTLKSHALTVLLTAFAAAASAAEPFIEKLDLFQAGDGGYKLYHIPGIVVTAKGTVLAWCEARKKGSDWDDIRILLRRSTDDGRSWSDPQSIAEVSGSKDKNPFALRLKNVDPTDVTYNNPVLIADRDGTVHMLFCLEYMRCFYQRSADDGASWSQPVEITSTFEAFRASYDWKVLATGPNHSIQLRTDRLVVPIWLSTGTGGNAHRPSVMATIYSDDGGKTWRAGDIAVPCTDELINPNETVAVELADGRVMLNVRNESTTHRRLITISRDGATGWSTPRFDDGLLEPICMAGIVRYSAAGSGERNRILFSNPHNLLRADGKAEPGKSRDRRNLSVKLSYDEGQTWSVSKTIEEKWSAYSDVAVTPSGAILCFYGCGAKSSFAGDRLTLARFNLEWLTDGSDSTTLAGRRTDAPATGK
jgi:sialidase-1